MTNIIDSVSLKDLPKILPKLSEQERRQLLFELEALDAMKQKELQQKKFIPFVKSVWPTFIAGRHHARMESCTIVNLLVFLLLLKLCLTK